MRGGKRPGAGRKAGDAWATKKSRPIRDLARMRVREALATASDPLEVLMSIATNEDIEVSVRVAAASNAAPYMFPRLSMAVVGTTNISAKDDGNVLVQRLLDKISRYVPRPVETAGAITVEGEGQPEMAAD